jgi:hypothetical protein
MADIIFPGEPAGGPINAEAMPENVDLVIYQGDTCRFTVTVTDANGTVINLTGYTAAAQLKSDFDDATPTNFTCTISTPASGIVSVVMSAATTAGLTPGSDYIWDVQVTQPGGDVRTYLAGDVTVVPEVTTL